jgi:hypothetical protein
MAGRAEILFNQLVDAAAVLALVGEAEDAHLDCKEWPENDDKDQQKIVSKGTCGLTNADGGVLVIGMKAESPANKKDDPDVITAPAPVNNTALVKSKVLGLISNLVEPGILNIEVREVSDQPNATSGFVIVHVPKSEGSPRRSRKDWKFYQRVGSATLPMEYWQIEDMFGKRPHPKLELSLEIRNIAPSGYSVQPVRQFVLGLTNIGKGIAKFPAIMFKRSLGLHPDSFGIDGNTNVGIRQRPSESELIVFSGGVDDVIYPGQTVKITKLMQSGVNVGEKGLSPDQLVYVNHRQIKFRYVYPEVVFKCEIACEGCQTISAEKLITEAEFVDSR